MGMGKQTPDWLKLSVDMLFLCQLQFYLRQWSLQLDVPIVSIDYSLAPEAPFPRALEECVMAYAWILLNMEQLGIIGHCPI